MTAAELSLSVLALSVYRYNQSRASEETDSFVLFTENKDRILLHVGKHHTYLCIPALRDAE